MMIPLLVNIMDHGPAARSPHIPPLSTPRSEVSPRQTIHLQLGRQNSWFMGITAALEPDVKHPPFIFSSGLGLGGGAKNLSPEYLGREAPCHDILYPTFV